MGERRLLARLAAMSGFVSVLGCNETEVELIFGIRVRLAPIRGDEPRDESRLGCKLGIELGVIFGRGDIAERAGVLRI